MKKIAFPFVLALFFVSLAQAQISGIGFRPAMTLSTYKLTRDYNDIYDAALKPGVGLSAFAEINLGNRFTLQPEVAFMQRGAHLKSESNVYWNGRDFGYPAAYTVTDYRQKETLNYIDIPLMLERNFGGGRFGAYLAAGPALSFAIGDSKGVEQITVEYSDGDGAVASETDRFEYPIEMGKGRNDDYKGFDLSLNAGGGLVYILERGEIGLDLRYSHGIKPLEVDGLKNRQFQIGLSYMFYFGH